MFFIINLEYRWAETCPDPKSVSFKLIYTKFLSCPNESLKSEFYNKKYLNFIPQVSCDQFFLTEIKLSESSFSARPWTFLWPEHSIWEQR